MSLFPALASNMLNMVGVGPFLTIPLMLAAMAGPQALLGWIFGALISLSDGLVWAELGAAMPDSGGSYDYLQQAFGPRSLGKLMGFLFLWQVMLVGPLTAASGGVGFADYARYLVPQMSKGQETAVAMAVCIVATFLLYRDIRAIGKISIVLWAALVLAVGIIIWGGATHFSAERAFQFPAGAFRLSTQFFLGLGAATLISTYDFSGYFNVCLIGGEIQKPESTIPRVVLLSIIILAVVYLAMSFSIIGVIPWRDAMNSTTVISDFTARLYGWTAARLMTALILVIAFASVFCVLLGYTRVPYAAAVQGQFFSSFARVHPQRGFPSFSVVAMGLVSAACCLLSLNALIRSLIVIQIITQFGAQCIGLMLIRRRRPDIARPFQMPLYPLPVLCALAGWVFVLGCSGLTYILTGVGVTFLGAFVYLWRARRLREWPFGTA
ncbi:MAG TPA: amino acid permease [Bryobacteraceae bacterium]|jgi:amino acid transporter|nr:amino acid permease [Bryobacteraceae bacterium]